MNTDACGKSDARRPARPVWRAEAGKRNRSNSVTAPPFDPTRAAEPTGADLFFEVISQRYERGSTIVTSDLPRETKPTGS